MRNFIISLALLCAFTTAAQETFEKRAKAIAQKIDEITKEEKDALKEEVEAVNEQLAAGTITSAEAEQRKTELAEKRAANIETRTAEVQTELDQLIQDRIEGKVKDQDTLKIGFTWVRKDKKDRKGESRTTSQAVFAFGLNNLVTNESIAHSDYKVWGSHFYEWGFTFNTRLMKDHNLLHLKYGWSIQYNNLRATDNRIHVEDGDQTLLVESPIDLRESRFRNVNLVLPLHLEFDFTKKKFDGDKAYFRTHESFRIGIGGYAGANIKTKQILRFEDEDGNKVKQRTKGDFNVNDFVYGLSAYVGYESISLYVKYDLQPIFKDNPVDQNNISFGLRFDLN